MATIKLKRSSSASAVGPTTEGEISTNLTDKKIFIGTGSAVVTYVDETQVDSKITTALSSAFAYRGTVAGNNQASTDTANSATDLAASPKAGDYYKVSAKGYVVANGGADTSAFFVNANDSVVYNGSSWDVIDNTNSTVASSGSSIAVTGSPDAGYNVEVSTVDGGSY